MKQRKPSAKAKRDTINLYWVTTDDHDEDWFILAATAQAARRYIPITKDTTRATLMLN